MDNTKLILQEKRELITAMANLEKAKKELEKKEKDMREQLLQAMEEYGVVSIDNEAFSVMYMPSSMRETFDTKRFKADHPEMALEYTKLSDVKASLRFKVK